MWTKKLWQISLLIYWVKPEHTLNDNNNIKKLSKSDDMILFFWSISIFCGKRHPVTKSHKQPTMVTYVEKMVIFLGIFDFLSYKTHPDGRLFINFLIVSCSQGL